MKIAEGMQEKLSMDVDLLLIRSASLRPKGMQERRTEVCGGYLPGSYVSRPTGTTA